MKNKRRRPLGVLATVASLSVVMAFVLVEPALAKPSDIGENIGNEIEALAKACLLALAALLGIPALAKRDIGQAMTLLLVLVVVGMFAFAPSDTIAIIRGFASAIAG